MLPSLARLLSAALLLGAGGGAPAAPDGATWLAPVEVASGSGVRGPWQQNESRYDFVDDPAVLLLPGGAALVAWVDQRRKEVLFQRFGADGRPQLPQPVDVSRSPATLSWLPRMALGRDGPQGPDTLHVLWQEIIFSGGSHGGEMLYARSQDGGRTFSAPMNLSRSVGGDGKGRINPEVWHNGSFDLVAGPGGSLHAAWTEYDGALWVSRSGDGGRSFAPPLRVDTGSARPARAPTLALDADGAVLLAWTEGDVQDADIHLARSADGGRSFAPARRLDRSPGYSDAPKLAAAPDGTVHLVHAESDGGPFGRYHVQHRRSTDGGQSFSAPQRVLAAPSGAQGVAFPSIGIDAGGRVHLLAEVQADLRERLRGLVLASSSDGGRSFGPGRPVAGSADPGGGANGSTQGLLMKKLAVAPDGTLAVVNSSLKPGSHSRVWLLRSAPGTR